MKRHPFFPLLLLCGLLGGCANYGTQVAPGRSLQGVQHYFVVSNQNDNRALDHHIAAALTARGLVAETGPITMMPEDTQAIVSYQDNWTWDFGEHLVYLQISIRDRKSAQAYATVNFSTRLPTRKSTSAIVDELIGRLVP